MESAYSVTRLSIAHMVAAHARTYTHTHKHKHTHTPQSMITHQGFRVKALSLTYRCYICRSLGLVVERPQCASLFAGPRLLHATLRPHEYKGVQIQTIFLLAVASLDKEEAYTFSSHQGEAESSYQFHICFNGAPKSCLTTGFANTCNRDRPITITTGLRFGFKIKSHKFLWEHFKKLLKKI